jgi:FlaA1/EpsC-like NDP-sugar epimerase
VGKADRASRADRIWQWATRGASQFRGDYPLVLIDLVLVVTGYLLLFLLRFDFSVPSRYWDEFEVFLAVACVVSIGSNFVWGAYGRTWRHASLDEAIRLMGAGMTTGLALLLTFVWGSERVPLTVLIAGPLLVTFLFGLVRFQSRLFAHRRAFYRGIGVRVAVIGATNSAAAAIREMQLTTSLGLAPVVIVDDNPNLRGRIIHGVPIAGRVDELPKIIVEHEVNLLLLATTSASPEVAQQVADAADRAGVPARVLRDSSSWAHGMPRLRNISDLDIGDLIHRRQIAIDLEPVRQLLHGRRVLVTGGGGWIGSEIARQVAEFGPAELVLLDHDETHLHDAVQLLHGAARIALSDIRDPSAVDAVFDLERPEVVFHAAAHKHVPILENYACEAVRTNVFGTLNVLNSCIRRNTGHLVCISTDKAADPSSVMGASKWLAEQILTVRGMRDGYCSVRFGNVLGSRGSVIPTFQRQIAAGGPVTVTDRAMTRYFMSTDEAVRLVLLAAALADGHKLLALEMGEQVNIYELAEQMIRLCGLRPHADIEIQITGVRPGEKLAETLVSELESHQRVDGTSLLSIEPVTLTPALLDTALETLDQLQLTGDHAAVRDLLLGIAAPATPASAAPGSAGESATADR